MKLRTTMIDAGNGKRFAESRDGADIDHDAAAAHALMQAMDEVGPCEILKSRASELLRECGFDSGEDA